MNLGGEAVQLTAPDAVIAPERREPAAQNLAALCIGALGVVFGDIGTSPSTRFGNASMRVPELP